MSPFSDGTYALRCRVCEDVTEPEPLETCRRCDGATDIAYDWEHLRGNVTPATIAAGPSSLWRYEALLPTRSHAGVPAGWTPLERNDSLSELLGVEPAQETDVVAVDENVQVARQRVVGQHALAERGMQRHQRGERVPHGSGVDRDRATAGGIGPEHRRNADDGHDSMIL